MIKALQKRFVVTAMIAIIALIAVLLGVINLTNAVMTAKQTDEKLSLIAKSEGDIDKLPDRNTPAPPDAPRNLRAPKNEHDMFLSSNFFTVRTDSDKNVVFTDTSRTSAVSSEEAKALAKKALDSNNESGRLEKYKYIKASSDDGKVTLIFLDTSEELAAMLRVLLISFFVGLICIAVMLVTLMFLSKRAVKPFAENFEKQKQFVTNAGHEIKTPLAIILANTEALELTQGVSKKTENIKEQTKRLSGLTENLLTLAKADELKETKKAEKFDLSKLSLNTFNQFAERFALRNITAEEDIEKDVFATADKNDVERIFLLLFDNAAKYTNDGGIFRFSLKKDGKIVTAIFENTCTSLPEAPPERLFERFYRADEARTQTSGGCGIGLSAARSLAQINGGKLSCDYKKPETIVFTLELRA